VSSASGESAQQNGATAVEEDACRPGEIPERLQSLIDRIQDVPTIPAVVTEVARLTADPDVSARKIADVISHDEALTGRLLRIVNSAYYGFARQIATVHDAIVVMGTSALRAAVLGATVFDAFHGGRPTEDYWLFRIHAARAAEATRRLAPLYGFREAGEAHVVGLLHDIGKPMISLYFPTEHEQIKAHCAKTGLPSIVGERRFLGATHGDLGGWLADRWQLPVPLRDAIMLHHQPGEAEDNSLLVALVHLGDIIAHTAWALEGNEGTVPPLNKAAWDRLRAIRPDVDREEIDVFAQELLDATDRVDALAAGLSTT